MKKSNLKKKVIAVVGPTASGKTAFAVDLANKINGEIISADSRLVYRGFDIVLQSQQRLRCRKFRII